MRFVQIIWDDPDDHHGNVAHIAEHGLTMDEVEHVLQHPTGESTSDSSGRPCSFGYTLAGASGQSDTHHSIRAEPPA